jgi:hypothetical protein
MSGMLVSARIGQQRCEMTRSLCVLIVTFILTTTLAAADLSGVWILELDPDFSGNQDIVSCGFAQTGNKLTVKCRGVEFAGEVDGQRVTWHFLTGRDNSTTATFSGVLDDQATSMSGTWHLASVPPQDGKFKAKKES